MVIVRAVSIDDVPPLMELIRQAGVGLTTLRLTRNQLLDRVERSVFAFTRRSETAGGDIYLLVMEDLASRRLVGTSCVFAKTGGYEPFFAYRLAHEVHESREFEVRIDVEVLHLTKVHDGPTELGSLFLLPEFRGQGRGRFLSLARFALMAMHPQRFDEEVIAEMRGVSDPEGNSPFWNAVARHFFSMTFSQADALSTWHKRFIDDLMPRFPIYIPLLPPEAQAVIGRVHDQTRPAVEMLEAEGFRRHGMVDIFDAGPVLSCRRDAVGAIARCQPRLLGTGEPPPDAEQRIIACRTDGFRAVLCGASLSGESEVRIADDARDALRPADPGQVFVLDPHPASITVAGDEGLPQDRSDGCRR